MNQKRDLTVYKWLKYHPTERPILSAWGLPNEHNKDPVKVLYADQEESIETILIWIFSTINIALLCVIAVVYFGFGKIYKWQVYHGKEVKLSDIYNKGKNLISNRYTIIRKRTRASLRGTGKSRRKNDVYERPTGGNELKEIRIYESGRRVTVTSRKSELGESSRQDSSTDFFEVEETKGLLNHIPFNPRQKNHIKDRRFSDFALLYPSAYDEANLSNLLPKKNASKWKKLQRKIPYRLTKQEVIRLEHLRSFKGRPLPPVPINETFFKDQENLFSNISHREYDFEEYRKRLVTPPLLHHINFDSTRSNPITDFCKQISINRKKTQDNPQHLSVNRSKSQGNTQNISPKPLRSMSLDDDFIATLKRRRKNEVRRSRSLDVINENNIIVNKLYTEVGEYMNNRVSKAEEVNGYLKLPNIVNSIEKNKKSEATSNNKCDKKSDPEYAKIEENFFSIRNNYNLQDLQNRPMPAIPIETYRNSAQSNRSSTDHIYQRASIIDRIREVNTLKINNPYEKVDNKKVLRRSLSDQLASFRSLSSTASGHYLKIIESD